MTHYNLTPQSWTHLDIVALLKVNTIKECQAADFLTHPHLSRQSIIELTTFQSQVCFCKLQAAVALRPNRIQYLMPCKKV